jgi:hypothetical protein
MKRQTNHTFHLIVSLLTCGLWLPVWGFVWLFNQVRRPKPVLTRPEQHSHRYYPWERGW